MSALTFGDVWGYFCAQPQQPRQPRQPRPAFLVRNSPWELSMSKLTPTRISHPSIHPLYNHVSFRSLLRTPDCDSLSLQLHSFFPPRRHLLGLHHALHPQGRRQLHRAITSLHHGSESVLDLEADRQGILYRHRTVEKSGLCGPFGLESDREHLVLPIGWPSWYV